MSMFKRIGRLFTIKTRFEAFLVTYAIAVGAVERGVHYMQQFPGYGGYLLALCCTGVVFIAGGYPETEIAPVLIVSRLEEFAYREAAAIAVVLLTVSFALLALINVLEGRMNRHER